MKTSSKTSQLPLNPLKEEQASARSLLQLALSKPSLSVAKSFKRTLLSQSTPEY